MHEIFEYVFVIRAAVSVGIYKMQPNGSNWIDMSWGGTGEAYRAHSNINNGGGKVHECEWGTKKTFSLSLRRHQAISLEMKQTNKTSKILCERKSRRFSAEIRTNLERERHEWACASIMDRFSHFDWAQYILCVTFETECKWYVRQNPKFMPERAICRFLHRYFCLLQQRACHLPRKLLV